MHYKILIAEDFENESIYLRSILEEKGHEVISAENGEMALQLFQEQPVDLVITDVKMPVRDGLYLLRSIKDISPDTPVVIISALAEIDIILKALRFGACDYITKPYEAFHVFKSIDRVSRLKGLNQTEKLCIQYLKTETQTFVFDNNPDKINHMARYLCSHLDKHNLGFGSQSIQISLIEALNNAVYHGNLEMPPEIRQLGNLKSIETYQRIVRERLEQKPYSERKVTIHYMLEQEKVSYVLRDEGPGFDYNRLPDPKNPENFDKPGGRGLLMMTSFCDEVYWNKKGNQVTLVKYVETIHQIKK